MAISRGELKAKILRILNRTSTNKGYYTDDKMNDAIEDGIDFITAEMHLAGEGWTNKITNLTTVAGQTMVKIPPDMSLINVVRYKAGTEYIPLLYQEDRMTSATTSASGETQTPASYRIVDNHLYFNPGLTDGGTDILQIEATTYPKLISSDTADIPAFFDKSMMHYLKFRSCSYLGSGAGGRQMKEWADFEAQWYDKMMNIVYKRNNTVQFVAEFNG